MRGPATVSVCAVLDSPITRDPSTTSKGYAPVNVIDNGDGAAGGVGATGGVGGPDPDGSSRTCTTPLRIWGSPACTTCRRNPLFESCTVAPLRSFTAICAGVTSPVGLPLIVTA